MAFFSFLFFALFSAGTAHGQVLHFQPTDKSLGAVPVNVPPIAQVVRYLSQISQLNKAVPLTPFGSALVFAEVQDIAPFNRNGKIITQGGYCSATLIGPRIGKTAAHCFSSDGKTVNTSWQFIPVDEFTQPYGAHQITDIWLLETAMQGLRDGLIPTPDDVALFRVADIGGMEEDTQDEETGDDDGEEHEDDRRRCFGGRRCSKAAMPVMPLRLGDLLGGADWGNFVVDVELPQMVFSIGYPSNLAKGQEQMLLSTPTLDVLGGIAARFGSDWGPGASGAPWYTRLGVPAPEQTVRFNQDAGTVTVFITDSGEVIGGAANWLTSNFQRLWTVACQEAGDCG